MEYYYSLKEKEYFRQISPKVAYACYVLNRLSLTDIIALDNYWLENEIISGSLIELNYSDPHKEQEFFLLFEKAMEELEIKKPNEYEAKIILIKYVSNLIVNKKLDLISGISDIIHNIWDYDDNININCIYGSFVLYGERNDYEKFPYSEVENELYEGCKKLLELEIK